MPPKPEYYHAIDKTVEVLTDNVKRNRLDFEDLEKTVNKSKDDLAGLRESMIRSESQLAALKERMDKWDTRLWGLLAILVGALLSLASGLIVVLVKK